MGGSGCSLPNLNPLNNDDGWKLVVCAGEVRLPPLLIVGDVMA